MIWNKQFVKVVLYIFAYCFFLSVIKAYINSWTCTCYKSLGQEFTTGIRTFLKPFFRLLSSVDDCAHACRLAVSTILSLYLPSLTHTNKQFYQEVTYRKFMAT